MLPSPLSDFGGPPFFSLGSKANSHSDSTDFWGLERRHFALFALWFGRFRASVPIIAHEPHARELQADDEDFLESSPVPQSPSRRSFSELPEDIAMNGLSPSLFNPRFWLDSHF
jgi:hypothetical protein